jgi:hypothetical protein
MVNRANVYLSVKLGNDRRNPFRVEDHDDYRRSHASSLKRDSITRRELADLGNRRSRLLIRLIEYLKGLNDGRDRGMELGFDRRTISQRDWDGLSARELAGRLAPCSPKQVRTHFDQLTKLGLVTTRREHANGPIRYETPEELTNVEPPFSTLPTIRSLTRN